MATMAELKRDGHNSSLIRKILDGVAFIAPNDTTLPDAYFAADGSLNAAPDGFTPLGIVEKDSGYTFGNDQDTEEVEGHGYSSAVRIDITKSTRSFTSVFLETRKETLEQYYGLDASAFVTGANDEIEFVEPELAARPHVRIVLIGSDGIGDDQFFFIKEFPNVQVTEVGELAWSSSDALKHELTYTAFPDPELGYSVKNIIGGPGAVKHREAMGFTAAIGE